MDRKLDAGALLVAAGALLLVVSLFLDWFGLADRTAISGWDAFEVLDLVLVAAAVAAVAAAFGRLDSRVLLGAAALAVVVVGSQLIQPPPAGQGTEREVGAWLALLGAVGMLAGAALSAAQIAVTVDVSGRERRLRVPAVDKRGAGAEPDAAPAGPSAQPVGDSFAPPRASRDEGGAVRVDPEATQPFRAQPDDAER